MTFDVDQLRYDEKGLIPVVVQSVSTKTVLMLAYMNKAALEKTLKTKEATYFSRSRQMLWTKGETSGNTQKVISLSYDCDQDSLLMTVEQTGVACHKNMMSCFHNPVLKSESKDLETAIFKELYAVLKTRKKTPKPESYTNYLFDKGLDKILKKIGEESAEVIIGAKNKDKENTVNEIADLTYHLLVLMVNEDIELKEITEVLEARRQ